ncbi:MAG: hypothetical protein QXU99_02160 [Candidatus Bathyarchaeia archaeon]
MYAELCAAWQREIESVKLEVLVSDFYSKVTDYIRRIKEETRMLDKKSIKAKLLERESQNVKRILSELVWARYEKIIEIISEGKTIPEDALTVEEAELCSNLDSFAEKYQIFVNNLLLGQIVKLAIKEYEHVVLRFIKPVPAIIGADMNTYGPFSAEDVASLPKENAKILVKQGLAVEVGTT